MPDQGEPGPWPLLPHQGKGTQGRAVILDAVEAGDHGGQFDFGLEAEGLLELAAGRRSSRGLRRGVLALMPGPKAGQIDAVGQVAHFVLRKTIACAEKGFQGMGIGNDRGGAAQEQTFVPGPAHAAKRGDDDGNAGQNGREPSPQLIDIGIYTDDARRKCPDRPGQLP